MQTHANGLIQQRHKYQFWGLLLAILLVSLTSLSAAWVSDDAYITFRSIDNWLNGDGLTWNIGERVQTYTHPLWMLLLTAVHGLTGEPFLATMLISVLITATSVLITGNRLQPSLTGLLLLTLLLTGSKAFIDYSTSGLENPLTVLLAVLFSTRLLNSKDPLTQAFPLLLLSCLAGLNRLDTLLFYFPAALWIYLGLCRQDGFRRATQTGLIAFIPLILWELFSLFYYGALIPNTAYAKLNTGIPSTQLWAQGIHYFEQALSHDPVTILVIIGTVIITLRAPSKARLVLLGGIMLYLLYILRVGGDFMAGRFLVLPFAISVLLLTAAQISPKMRLSLSAAATIVILLTPQSPWYNSAAYDNQQIDANGIADERGYYFQHASLLTMDWKHRAPTHPHRQRGQQLRHAVTTYPAIGYYGYYAPRTSYIVDPLALSDPLLARLPIPDPDRWRVGHYARELPANYLNYLNGACLQDNASSQYLAQLKHLISGPLFDPERLQLILKLNSTPPPQPFQLKICTTEATTLQALLLRFSQHGTLTVAVMDEASSQLSAEVKQWFLDHGGNLNQLTYRGSYAAIIHNGVVIAEQINNQGPASVSTLIKNQQISVESRGLAYGNTANITLNGQPLIQPQRGLNIVGWDQQFKLAARTRFDTFISSQQSEAIISHDIAIQR